ncbi:efflux RND transporter periplasmic adaptor subunit [Pseudomonas cavernae]|uniref:Efflux RND transporter periplasmic adaptor subunit n=1 Tax=Pseudomonas cavernae TaxID=2320867 RepID=A0A385Z632_9PSED|nr:efflux RND transporter periplasmic adaptor subunit [Pseudomonas cavernae]AYC34161.1 efflux RND transporter periplasmic adaptor subunit [Pseudomonas cavernae]
MLLRRMLTMLGVVLVVVLLLASYKAFSIREQIKQFSAPQPPISVSAAIAEQRQWQERLPAIGTLKASQGVDLTVEVTGTVRDVLFRSGEHVAAHQPLIQMDGAVEQASLESAEAELNLARVEFERGRSLISRQMISKSDFDRLASQLQQNSGRVAQLKALLGKKRILAPFAGTIGIRQIDVGDYLASGTTIATLQDLSTLYVDFFLPEQAVPKLQVGQRVQLGVAAFPGEAFMGELAAINPKVDENTRNVQVRATLPNPGEKLLPGMFANLTVLLPNSAARVVVPETAVTFSLYGNSIYVVEAEKNDDGSAKHDDQGQPRLVAKRVFVETGERRDGEVVVLKGLTAGQQVVTTGQLKLDNGAHVSIVAEPAARTTSQASGR